MHGIFLIDKPKGSSSAKAIALLKKKFSIPKIGHAGTLDPLATGLLIVMCGKATKLSDYIMGGQKRYSGTILLGRETTTDDLEGETTLSTQIIPGFEQLLEHSKKFIGSIQQRPPNISAVKIDGKRAYKITRAGGVPQIKTREVTISEFRIKQSGDITNTLDFEITCSSGTYIRSIARDLGREAGCYGCISELRREGSSPFSISQAQQLEEVTPENILAWEKAFPFAPVIEVPDTVRIRLLNGQKAVLNDLSVDKLNQFILKEKATGSCFLYGSRSDNSINEPTKLIFL